MIANERQYRITKRRLMELRETIEDFNVQIVAERVGSARLAAAELEALRSEDEILTAQLREYDELQLGVTKLEAPSLAELPRLLIQARIARGLSQRDLAELIGLKEQQIQRYESDGYLAASFRRLQEIAKALGLSITESAEIRSEPTTQEASTREQLDWDKFPVKEMYRRGWFRGFTGSLNEALRNSESLVRDFVTDSRRKPAMALHRQRVRSGSLIDPLALLAWECRVIELAKPTSLSGMYREQSIAPDWIAALVKFSSQQDGPLRAKVMLQEAGIALVVEPHLPGTHLDGAAILYDDLPVIGMTIRHDRLDNFWFVLFHELFHILKHLRKGTLERVFDDLDAPVDEQIEVEADQLAREALVPAAEWNRALARFVRSPESVRAFATQLGIHPAIVAGRVRHEANNYIILSDLVGQGEVRKHFTEAKFGV